MKAMILAAGLGTRLGKLTETRPKPMMNIAGKPLLDHIMELLKSYNFTEVIANLHYLPDIIIDHIKDIPLYDNFEYIVENGLSGSAGGLLKCKDFFKDTENFLVISGDVLTNMNLAALYNAHLEYTKRGAICTMALKAVDLHEVYQYGIVYSDLSDKVVKFQEKPIPEKAHSPWANTGIYMFNKKIFDYIEPNKFQDFAKDVFPKLLENEALYSRMTLRKVYWNDIGTLEKYTQALVDMEQGKVEIL